MLIITYVLASSFLLQLSSALERRYFIGIVEISWDYSKSKGVQIVAPPKGVAEDGNMDHHAMHHGLDHSSHGATTAIPNMAHGHHHGMHDMTATTKDEDSDEIRENGTNATTTISPINSTNIPTIKIDHSQHMQHHHHHHQHHHNQRRSAIDNSTFIKAVFRLFTDSSFTKQMEHPAELGLLGPLILAAPGDRVLVHCKNFARFDFNLHPHLVRYDADEGPGVAAYGGDYVYDWYVQEEDGPVGEDEPCILGAYHSGLNSLTNEIEGGLFGPMLICKKDVAPEKAAVYALKSGEMLAFAIPKVFNENESVYGRLNNASHRLLTAYPTINGLTRTGADFSSISLLNRLDCGYKAPNVYLHTFTLGGYPDFQLMSTSCGLMMKNGKSMSDTLPLYPGSFRIVSISSSEIFHYTKFTSDNGNGCFLQSVDTETAAAGLNISFFPSKLNCSSRTDDVKNTSLSSFESYNVSLAAVFWDYGNNNDGTCTKFWKLRFMSAHRDSAVASKFGLLGPTIKTSVSQQFEVLFTVPRSVVAEIGEGYSKQPQDIAVSLKMPDIVEELAHVDESNTASIIIRYTYVVKPSQIGTRFDSPCRPFLYSASFSVNGVINFSSSSFDSGLFGTFVVCQNDKFLRQSVGEEFSVAPIVIDETRSWLSPLNKDCLQISRGLFHTINGVVEEADFGTLKSGREALWYLLSVPTLPGRPLGFQYSLTFSDEGRRNPIYSELYDAETDALTRVLIPGSTVVLHGSGQAVVMGIGRGSYVSPYAANGLDKWKIFCQLTGHYAGGMRAIFSTDGTDEVEVQRANDKIVDQYFIVAEEVDWDYNGNVSDSEGGGHGHHHGHLHGSSMNDQVLLSRRHIFRKLLYRPAFKQNRVPSDAHLSILGPIVVLTPESPVHVTLMNLATKPVSINPGAGVISSALNGSSSDILADYSVPPGKAVTFVWRLPSKWPFVPHPNKFFPECSATLYTSGQNKVGDLYAGLLGPLLICPSKKISPEHKEEPSIRRFFALFARFDESKSSIAAENDLKDSEIKSPSQPLIFDTLNGRLNGVLDKPGFAVYANQSIDWFMYSVGNFDDVHMVHFHGASFGYVDSDTRNTLRVADTVTVFPGQSITGLAVAGRMQPIPPGLWPIHCHVAEHATRGMMGQYIVYDQAEPASQRAGVSKLFPNVLLVVIPLLIFITL